MGQCKNYQVKVTIRELSLKVNGQGKKQCQGQRTRPQGHWIKVRTRAESEYQKTHPQSQWVKVRTRVKGRGQGTHPEGQQVKVRTIVLRSLNPGEKM